MPGLTIGYNFKRFSFETGILSEVSRFTVRVSNVTNVIGSPQGSKTYYLSSQLKNSGIKNLRFPLRLHYRLCSQKDERKFNPVYFFVGVDLLTPSFSAWGNEPFWGMSSETFIAPYSGEEITYQSGSIHRNRVTFAPSVGFMLKLKYKNRFELCNLHLDWHFNGFAEMGSYQAVFTSSSGMNYIIYNKLSAQGIILKLSRDFTYKLREGATGQ